MIRTYASIPQPIGHHALVGQWVTGSSSLRHQRTPWRPLKPLGAAPRGRAYACGCQRSTKVVRIIASARRQERLQIMRRNMASEVAACGNTITKDVGWRMWLFADVHFFLAKCWSHFRHMHGSAQDPRNYQLRVSLRAFRRTRVIWSVARAQKRRTIWVAKLFVYLNQALCVNAPMSTQIFPSVSMRDSVGLVMRRQLSYEKTLRRPYRQLIRRW